MYKITIYKYGKVSNVPTMCTWNEWNEIVSTVPITIEI